MGGSIALTLRTRDGQVFKQHRWTNPLPFFTKNPHFFEEDNDDYIEEYLNRENDDEPWRFLAPMGYGLVVIDFQKKRLLSMQGYCSFDDELFSFYEHNEDPGVEGLFEAKRIKKIRYTTKSKKDEDHWKSFKPLSTARASFEKLKSRKDKADHCIAFADIDIKPWVFERFPETPLGERGFRTAINKLGFELTSEDETEWKKWAQERWVERDY